ncbi:MAG: hypothetical protein DME08_07375 [Candidatus Rokuibacteriota bacterium]|nr:MAG: hypothetical protein DME08_07375 [Candidatus Rokubacteria bacterium]
MIGSAEPRVGGERLASGAGRFVADVRVPGMLEAAVLRSRHAHARVGRIDARRALALPGVRAVLTAADVPDKAVIPHRVAAPDGTARYLQPAIARGVVRYAGEPIALVIAEDRYVAVDALALIDVAYEPLPVCATVEAALTPGAPRLFANTDSNNVAVIRMRVGDADRAIGEAPLVIRERFTYPRQTACALETRGLVAVPPAVTGGELHLLGSTKCIHINRSILAPIFELPMGGLRLTEVDVGGGFGVRGELYPEDILIPLAALQLGRPVRFIEDRSESLLATNHARELTNAVEIGFDRDGRIVAIRSIIHADIGAYVRTAGLVPAEFGAALLPGPYRVPHYSCDLWSVVTNKTPVGTLRSPGRPECNFVRERLLDAAAVRLGIDAAEIRKRNLIRADEMPYDIGTVSFGVNTVYDSGDFPGLLDTLLTRLDYAGARAEQQRLAAQGVRRGIGLAVYVEKTGLGPFETAQLEAHANGRITVDTGAASMGPGLETHMAAAKLLSEARRRAATRLAVAEDEIKYGAGVLTARGREVTLGALAAERRLAVGASFNVPKVTYAGCAVAVVADVDIETGLVTLRRIVVGADVGRAVNPALIDGQLTGGVAFGIGNTLLESLQYDAEGQLLTGSLMDYALPAADHMPPVESFYQEVPAHTNPLGLRGLGECGNPGLSGAIANAVCDALRDLDVSLTALPVTPARVFAAIRARR